MSDKPSYLGLLNAISVAETRAHCYFSAWMEATPSPDVRNVLATVAAREGEHGMAFAKRINELGYEVRQREDPDFERRLALVRSDCSDVEKMEGLGVDRADRDTDVFDDIFRDHSIDIRTGELLGRYVAEERDTARLLRSCYEQLKSAAGEPAGGSPVSRQVAALEAKVDALCGAVDDLRRMVGANLVAADGATKSGRRRDN